MSISAADAVGNIYTGTVGTIELDDLGPYADLMLTTTTVTATNGILQGVVSDIPYPAQGKLLHLHFEEAAGSTFADSSGNRYTATCSSCPAAGSAGKYGSALSFDGLDDSLTIPSHQNLVVTNTTFMAWVKPAWSAGANGYNPTLLAMDDGSQTGYRWQISDDYQSMILDNGSQSESMPVTVSANEWVHLAMTVENGRMTSYVNGIAMGTVTQTLGVQINLPLHIGSATGNSGFFNGLLDEVTVYNQALNAEIIYDIANPLAGGISDMQMRLRHLNGSVWTGTVNPEGLRLYYPFDDEAGTTTLTNAGSRNLSTRCGYYNSCPTIVADGLRDNGILFDSHDSIVFDDESAFDFQQMAIGAWIKVDGFNKGYASIATKNYGWSFRQNGNENSLEFVTYHVGENPTYGYPHSLKGTVDVADGEWHFVTAVYDGQTKRIYIDGVLDAQEDVSSSFDTELYDSGLLANIGGLSNITGGFNGLMDEVVIYNRALDQSEIVGLMNTNPWQDVTLAATTDNFTTWQYALPANLEGSYSIDLIATDSHGHVTELPNVWFGDIDVAGPRLTFTYDALDANNVQSRCVAEDLNLTADNWDCPAAGLTHIPEDADWVVDHFSPVTRTGKIESPIQTLNTNANGTMTACDLHGNCTTITVNPTAKPESSAIVTPCKWDSFHHTRSNHN